MSSGLLHSGSVCIHRAEAPKKFLGVSGQFFSKSRCRVRRKRIDSAVDLGEIEIPNLFRLVAVRRCLRNHLKHSMAGDLALSIIDDPTAGADHSVNHRASEIRKRKPCQIVSLLAADELICIGRGRGDDCERRLRRRSTGGDAKTCCAFGSGLGGPSARKRHGKRTVFVEAFRKRQGGNSSVIVCDPFRFRRCNAPPRLGS